jgi:hypothetical protein
MGAAGGLAVDGNNVRVGLAQSVDPGDEAFGEQRGVKGDHQVVEGIMAGDAVAVGQEAAQEVDMGFVPVVDLDEVVGSGDAGAQHQRQNFRERVQHLAALPRVLEGGKAVQQGHGFAGVMSLSVILCAGHNQRQGGVLCQAKPIRWTAR